VDNIIEIINTAKLFEWGPAIPQYFFFTGVSAAAFLISSLAFVFGSRRYRPIAGLALILAFTVLAAAPLNLIADLAQTGRFYELLYRVHLSSPMSWGVFLLIGYALLMGSQALFAFRSGFARRASQSSGLRAKLYRWLALGDPRVTPETEARDRRLSKLLGAAGIPFAIGIEIYTGFLLFFAVGRPLWNSPLMPVVFLVSGLVSGFALLILLSWLMVRGRQGQPLWSILDGLGVLLGWTILVDLALRLTWHSLAYNANPAAYAPVIDFLFRQHFVETVILEAVLGMLLPAVVMLAAPLRRVRPLFLTAAFLTFAGVWLFRWDTVIGGEEIPKILAGYYAYSPAVWGGTGIMQVVANWSLWLFLFILFTWFVPWRPAKIEPTTQPTEAKPATQATQIEGGAS
jgi:tetrathionate reductase subunit C